MERQQGFYRKRLLLYFSAVFVVFAVLLVSYQLGAERGVKEDTLRSKLDIYSDMVEYCLDSCAVSAAERISGLNGFVPDNLRITIVGTDGDVWFDSEFYTSDTIPSGKLENHASRPEIMEAMSSGTGSEIRKSDTAGIPYFYFAKSFGDHIVRVALPYDGDVKDSFRPNALFIAISFVIFLVAILAIAILSGYFGHGVSQLHDMIDMEKEKYKEMKHQMTNNIAHELRTPVSSIRGYLETLTTCADIPPERQKAFIQRAYIQTIRLSDLIRDIALITKIEEASDQLVREDLCIRNIVDEIFAEFREEMERKNVVAENMLDNIHIYGNATLVYAIFRNLVENSLKYGGGNLTIHVECLGFSGGKCNLVYYDTGKGVGEQHLSRLFERFYRVSEGRTRDDGGSGLGLSIVRNAIAFHKGDISASIRPSGGLEYHFTLSVK